MTVCSTTALRKYLTQHSNLGQPSREKAVSTTRAHAEGETIINSGRYRRPLFKSSQESVGEVQGRLAAAREDQSRSVRARDQARADLATAQQQLAALTKVPRTDQRAGRAGSALLAASILFCPAGTAGSLRALCPPHESWGVANAGTDGGTP